MITGDHKTIRGNYFFSFSSLSFFFSLLSFFGNNELGAVGTTRWWPPGIALQERRFSKKDENVKGKIPALMVVRSLME